MGGMLGGMESRLKADTEAVRDQLGRAIDDLGSRVELTERRLDNIAEEVHLIVDKRLAPSKGVESSTSVLTPDCPVSISEGKPSYASAAAKGLTKSVGLKGREERMEDEYWRCRRALRLRPIRKGNDKEEVLTFLREHLGLDPSFISCLGDIIVQRVPYGPAVKVKDEAVVSFQSVGIRDSVRAAARNLAGKGPSYGVRLEIPDRMNTDMKALQAVSYELCQKFPDSRRNVLFNDDAQRLVLDFCIEEGGKWRTMTAAQARDRKKKSMDKFTSNDRFDLREGEIDSILDAEESCPDE